MIWIILAALGVPIWLVVGAFGSSIWSRKRFQASPGVFKCKLRRESGAFPGLKDAWPRMPSYARWVHDVLIVHTGLALVRNNALPVVSVEVTSTSDDVPAPTRLGSHPAIIELRLDDSSVVMLAVPMGATRLQHGPFNQAAAQPVGIAAN